jgi:eukaryotic-like serine/threonine-protein kinase
MVDRKGNVRPITGGHDYLEEFSVSKDGRFVAASVTATNNDIWTYDIQNGTPLRLTFEPPEEKFPQWTPDGTHIAFGNRLGKIFWKLADGSGERQELSHGEFTRYPSSFSPDGKTLAFVEVHPSRQRDIWLMSVDGDRKAQPFQSTDADEWGPKFSSDGRWIAYVSNETGRDEIYIRPADGTGGKRRISTGGGRWPAWNRNGHELFFLQVAKLIAVGLDGDVNRAGPEHVILDPPRLDNMRFEPWAPYYDVMPDGDHFVMLLTSQLPPFPTHYNIIINWFEELKQRMH